MTLQEPSFLGVGLYTVPEAARLTRVSPNRIRRWLRGYSFTVADGTQHLSPPVWQRELTGDELALTFRDLIEVRFVHAFREAGLSWRVIRQSADRAADLFQTTHPFATRRFYRTDGRRIFAETLSESGEEELLDLFENQYTFRLIIEPYLFGLQFVENDLLRWWPLGVNRRVVIDPQRSFGEPITPKESVPTRVIMGGVRAEGSHEKVARWFGIPLRSVRDAVEFETGLAAAA